MHARPAHVQAESRVFHLRGVFFRRGTTRTQVIHLTARIFEQEVRDLATIRKRIDRPSKH